jgi:hypothetical protein
MQTSNQGRHRPHTTHYAPPSARPGEATVVRRDPQRRTTAPRPRRPLSAGREIPRSWDGVRGPSGRIAGTARHLDCPSWQGTEESFNATFWRVAVGDEWSRDVVELTDRTGGVRQCSGVEGNKIEDYDLDAVVRRFQLAVARALAEGRGKDAADFLVAEQIVCVIRGDYLDDE